MPFDQPPFPSTFDVGTPGAGHIHFGSDGTMTLFGPDGVTAIATLTPATGLLLAGQKYLQLATGDPAEGPLPAEIFAQNSPADNVTPNRRPVLELVGSSANSSGDVLPGVFIFGKSYDLTVPSEIQLHAHSTSIFAEAGATTTRVLLLSNASGGGGALGWDGATLNVPAPNGTAVDVADFQVNGVTLLAVDKNGHLAGRGATPAAAAGANAGTTPPAPVITGTDQAGSVTFGTGTAPAAGIMVALTFARAFAAAPRIVITPTTAAAAALQLYVTNITTTTWGLRCAVAPAASQANTVYGFNYAVIG